MRTRSGLWLAAMLVALCVHRCASASSSDSGSVLAPIPEIPGMSHEHVAAAMDSVDSQVESALRKMDPESAGAPFGLGLGAAPQKPAPQSLDPVQRVVSDSVLPRFRAVAANAETAQALNSLDLKLSNSSSDGPGPKEAHPRNVVAAFGSIAAETVQRANFALVMLKNQKASLESAIATETKELYAWLEQQKAVAKDQIRVQQDRLSRLQDEVSHLQNVHQDAIAKERSYQVQANMLISERQLQRTPPVMPVEMAASLPEAQFQEAVGKLAQWRKAALQVIADAKKEITIRQSAIDQITTWVAQSEKALKDWTALQSSLIERHLTELKEELGKNKARSDAIVKISEEATAAFKAYSNVIARIDIKNQLTRLNELLKHYQGLASQNPYEDAHIKSTAAATKVEIGNLEKKLKDVPGDEKSSSPPASWGVLNGFPAGPPVVFPEPIRISANPNPPAVGQVWLHPYGIPEGLPPNADPLVSRMVPTRSEHQNDVLSPNFPSPVGWPLDALPPAFPPAPSASGSKSSLLEEQARLKPHAPAAFANGPPPMPNLPPPPNADLLV